MRLNIAAALFLLCLAPAAQAQTTTFTYQGSLTENGSQPTGPFDFEFRLFNAGTGGTQIGSVVTKNDLGVTNGLFTVQLDFGSAFDGSDRFLAISVRPGASTGVYTALNPRQQITSSPYAVRAALAGGLPNQAITGAMLAPGAVNTSALGDLSVTATKLAPGAVTSDQIADGSIAPGDLDVAGFDGTFWRTAGNAGTSPGTQFIGTSDNNPLTIKVNNATVLRFEPAAFGPNVIGGLAAYRPTVVTPGVRGAVVAGGGAPAGPVNGGGGGDFFAVYDSDGAIGGGFGNKVGTDNGNVDDSPFATVAGGVFNWAANYASTIAGGDGNYAGGVRAAIGGGTGNQALSEVSVIAGGQANVVQSNSPSATIGGGQNNSISPGGLGYVSAKGATIGGGEGNTVFGSGGFPEGPLVNEYGTIGGGYHNTVQGSYGTVPGGYLNTASGDYSFAAGSRAAAGYGCFVWADASSPNTFSSTADNQFNIRANGGVRLNSDTSIFFGNQTRQMLNLWSSAYGIGIQSSTVYFRTDTAGGFSWFRGGVHSDSQNNPGSGGTEVMRLDAAGALNVRGTVTASSLILTSDRNAKGAFAPIDPQALLEKVAALPVSEWSFKAEPGERHIGPMAQDFYAAFHAGADDRHIAVVDEGGVALAAIQGLNRKVEDRSEETGARMQKAEARIQNTEVSVRHSEARMRETEASLLEKEERIRQLERLNGDLLRRLEAMEGRIDELNSRSLAGMNAIK